MSDDIRPVLIAYDGSTYARAAVREATKLLRSAPVLVVSVWTPIESVAAATIAIPTGLALAGARAIDAASREQAERLAEDGAKIARSSGLHAEPRAIEGAGPVWNAIVRFADEIDAAVVVTGTRGRSRLASTVLGSTAQGVLAHAHRPVLVVAED